MVRAVSLSTNGTYLPQSNSRHYTYGIRSLRECGIPNGTRDSFRALPPYATNRGQPKSCFEENQLSPSTISVSLLSTSHPRILQHSRVRSSPPLSRRFNLLMDRSPGFGSNLIDKRFLKLAFAVATSLSDLTKPIRVTRRLILQ